MKSDHQGKAHQKWEESQSGQTALQVAGTTVRCWVAHRVGQQCPWFRELATGLAPAACPPQGAGSRHMHHSLCQLTDKGEERVHSTGPQGGRPTLATRRKADVTKQPAVLTCHVPQVQSIKKQHPSWMGSLLTHWFWREKVEMIRVPHFQVSAQGLTPALLRSGWI